MSAESSSLGPHKTDGPAVPDKGIRAGLRSGGRPPRAPTPPRRRPGAVRRRRPPRHGNGDRGSRGFSPKAAKPDAVEDGHPRKGPARSMPMPRAISSSTADTTTGWHLVAEGQATTSSRPRQGARSGPCSTPRRRSEPPRRRRWRRGPPGPRRPPCGPAGSPCSRRDGSRGGHARRVRPPPRCGARRGRGRAGTPSSRGRRPRPCYADAGVSGTSVATSAMVASVLPAGRRPGPARRVSSRWPAPQSS